MKLETLFVSAVDKLVHYSTQYTVHNNVIITRLQINYLTRIDAITRLSRFHC
jgi:hypothetical protein